MVCRETARMLRLEKLMGVLLAVCNGGWLLTHWHKPADRVTDFFVALGAVGAIIFLRAQLKLLKQNLY
jgi:hypothetical protein